MTTTTHFDNDDNEPIDPEVQKAWDEWNAKQERSHFWLSVWVPLAMYTIPALIIAGITFALGSVTTLAVFGKLVLALIVAFWLLDMGAKIVLKLFGMIKDQPLNVGNVIVLGLIGFALAAYIW
ncbi:hypothetical protein [Ensifer sp. SL37]|uniref:hypothetical protein n=1 Tax=Ensifer sp. SL37 TaxID=2995137 RepID=UPI00227285A6|nr:hypothetical protein [Ensifer sp. SL37]MCY1740392.1 hypothetical protein [Ensifer sp. SL37]